VVCACSCCSRRPGETETAESSRLQPAAQGPKAHLWRGRRVAPLRGRVGLVQNVEAAYAAVLRGRVLPVPGRLYGGGIVLALAVRVGAQRNHPHAWPHRSALVVLHRTVGGGCCARGRLGALCGQSMCSTCSMGRLHGLTVCGCMQGPPPNPDLSTTQTATHVEASRSRVSSSSRRHISSWRSSFPLPLRLGRRLVWVVRMRVLVVGLPVVGGVPSNSALHATAVACGSMASIHRPGCCTVMPIATPGPYTLAPPPPARKHTRFCANAHAHTHCHPLARFFIILDSNALKLTSRPA